MQISEARALTQAANNVIRHYDIAATQQMLDWGALVTVAFGIYLPRVSATMEARERRMREATAGPPATRANVTTLGAGN